MSLKIDDKALEKKVRAIMYERSSAIGVAPRFSGFGTGVGPDAMALIPTDQEVSARVPTLVPHKRMDNTFFVVVDLRDTWVIQKVEREENPWVVVSGWSDKYREGTLFSRSTQILGEYPDIQFAYSMCRSLLQGYPDRVKQARRFSFGERYTPDSDSALARVQSLLGLEEDEHIGYGKEV